MKIWSLDHVSGRRKLFWAIVIFAFVIRLVFIFTVNVKPMGDSQVYEETALNILNRGTAYSVEGYAHRPPLYPYFVAGIFAVLGESPQSIFIGQTFLGAAGAAFLFLIGMRISLKVAATASMLFAIHPLMLFYTKQVMTESLHIFLAILLTFLLVKILEGNKPWFGIAAGVIMGLIILCRSETSLLCGIFLILILSLNRESISNRIKTFSLICFTCLCTLAPWMVRNHVLLGAPVVTSNGGTNLYGSNNAWADGGYFIPKEKAINLPSAELERDKYYFRKGLEYIRANPTDFLILVGKRQVRLWSANRNRVLDATDLLLLPLTLFGFVLASRDRKHWRFYLVLFAPILALILVYLIFAGHARYRTPIYPFLIGFASISAVHIFDFLKRSWTLKDNIS